MTTPYYLKLDKVFSKFVNKYLTADNEIKKEDLSSLKYDLYLVGSDQVWNITLTGNDKTFFCDFAMPESICCSYAASIGSSAFSNEELQNYKQLIDRFALISFREKELVPIFEKIASEKKICSVVDPVFLLVRNFLCVGIPYFCIGNLIREKRCSEKWNRKILQVLIVVFTITSLAERFVLVSAGLNATRDHYLSTTFLAICLFVYTLKSNWHNKGLAVIGRKCSTWLYIIHPIFITAFSVATGKLGIKSIYRCVAPIVTYCATLTFLIVMCRLKSLLVKNNQRK